MEVHHELVERCRKHDRKAYYELYNLYHRSMYNTALRITQKAEVAEDAMQEAFISAFENLSSFRGDSTFGAWLKRIVVNKAITYLGKHKMERLPEDERWDMKEEEPVDIFEGFPFTVEKVRAAIFQLPDGYRSVLSLYLLEGYDHSEIAQIMGITQSTSKSQYNRSKKKLKELLQAKM